MPWIQLKLNTTGANAEELSDALMEAGSVSITFQDTHDTPVFEPLPGETRLWGDTDVIGLFDAETDMKEVVAILENHPLLGAGFAHKIEQLEDKDWEREWMDNFHPMQFGKRLWICPSWREVPDENAVNVMLDPGLAFGTGTHPTTSLCLQWLDGLDLDGKTVIDYWDFRVSWQARQTACVKPTPIFSLSTRWWRKKSGAVLPVVKNKHLAWSSDHASLPLIILSSSAILRQNNPTNHVDLY